MMRLKLASDTETVTINLKGYVFLGMRTDRHVLNQLYAEANPCMVTCVWCVTTLH